MKSTITKLMVIFFFWFDFRILKSRLDLFDSISINIRSCNDLFSRFEQQILFLEKLSWSTDPTMDRHGHDGPSRGSRFKILRNSKIWVLKSTL